MRLSLESEGYRSLGMTLLLLPLILCLEFVVVELCL